MNRPNTTNRIRGKRNWAATGFVKKAYREPGGTRPTHNSRGHGVALTRGTTSRRLRRRARSRMNGYDAGAMSFDAVKGIRPRHGLNAQKRELLVAAKEVGFRGKSIRKAQKFEKRFERSLKARQT